MSPSINLQFTLIHSPYKPNTLTSGLNTHPREEGWSHKQIEPSLPLRNLSHSYHKKTSKDIFLIRIPSWLAGKEADKGKTS